MPVRQYIIIFFLGLTALSSSAQCDDRATLWNRLVFLRDSSAVHQLSIAEQLTELLSHHKKIQNCPYRFDSIGALLMQRTGAMYYYQGDYLNAASCMQQSIDIVNNNAHKNFLNKRQNIRSYYSLAIIYDSLDNIAGKMKALDSCAMTAIRLKSADIYAVRAMTEITEYLYSIGDYHKCVEYATISERVSSEYALYASGDDRLTGKQWAWIGFFWKINSFLALKQYETAEKLLYSRVDECKRSNLSGYLGTIYQQMAKVQLEKGNRQKALLNYDTALNYEKQAGESIACKAILSQVGFNVYFEKYNDPDKALFYCKKAFSYINKDESEKSSDAFLSLNIFTNIANIYVRKNLFDSAFINFQRAFDRINTGMNENILQHIAANEFSKQKYILYLADLLISKGNAFVELFKMSKKEEALDKAIGVYKATEKILNRIKAGQSEFNSKLFWRSNYRRLYESAIEACFMKKKPEEAFYFFEKSRAILLNDELVEHQWLGQQDIMNQALLKKKWKLLKNESDTIQPSSVRYAVLQTEMVFNKQEQEKLLNGIKERNPVYYQSVLDTNFAKLEDIRTNVLRNHGGLLELFNGDSAAYSLFITAKNVYLYRISKTDYDNTLRLYNSYLSESAKINARYNEFIQTASHLYQLIFQNNAIPAGRIIISPDGQYFPFESMVTSKPGEAVNYFINDHAVSYTYSARFLLYDFSNNSAPAGKNFLGIAPVNYPASFSLASLSGSDHSLSGISSHFTDAVNLVNAEATRNNFLQQFSQYKIIQLYTHAADSSSNNEPVIYFGDSTLYLSDLIGESKPLTRLIVLSACETGLGKEYKGEGVFSFNRGFAALGIPSSVTNLWTIDNESTYKLTELFYKYVADGLPLDVALQKAKLEFIKTASKEKQLPYYWAASVLVGNTDSILITKNRNWPYYAAAGIPVLLFILFIIIRKRKWLILTRDKAETVS